MIECKEKSIFLDHLENFAEHTSIHGFSEIRASKSRLCKGIWFLLTVAAVGITTYQMASTAIQFMENPTTTVIHRVEPEKLLYPPLKLCYSHWSAWINFSAAAEMNFTRSEVYYAMSYLTPNIYSVEQFDVKSTGQSFFKKLQVGNWTMSKFLLKLARQFDALVLGLLPETPLNYSATFEPLDYVIPIPNRYYVLCYTFPESTMSNLALAMFRKEEKSEGQTGHFISRSDMYTLIVNPSLLEPQYGDDDSIDFRERNQYLKYISGVITNFPAPPHHKIFPTILHVNAYGDEPLVVTSEIPVSVKIKASGYIWQNRKANACVKDRPYILNNRTCHDQCVNKFDLDHHLCKSDPKYPAEYSFMPEAFFYFLGNNERFKSKAHFRCIPKATTPFHELSEKQNYECINKCRADVGCLVWAYDVLSEKRLQNGLVTIQYPIPEHTVILEEIDWLTWENFTANVGGLLGIWMGASMLTVLQIVHLCCCCARSNRKCKKHLETPVKPIDKV